MEMQIYDIITIIHVNYSAAPEKKEFISSHYLPPQINDFSCSSKWKGHAYEYFWIVLPIGMEDNR